ncbi:hypothetical protein [Alteromonas flava]|uniref:hypothetical protein n=1 Tax=Alteromonas flava TaxID=2048003 RepID=UPI000C290D9A|nr:hypothetical protein [Alteromonas flava]
MRIFLLMGFVFAMVACSSTPIEYNEKATGKKWLVKTDYGEPILELFKRYESASNHKAYAISENYFSIAWVSEQTSASAAAKLALEQCNEQLDSSIPEEERCKVINVNDQWASELVRQRN